MLMLKTKLDRRCKTEPCWEKTRCCEPLVELDSDHPSLVDLTSRTENAFLTDPSMWLVENASQH